MQENEMAFDDIPEDKELSFPCTCGGNIKERGGRWECDSCDWKWECDKCGQVSDFINAPIMISAWSSGDANYSIRSGVDILKCTAVGSTHTAVPSDNAEELSTAPTSKVENEMKKKPILALKFLELRDELQDVCEEITAEINQGNRDLALLMLGRDKAEQVGKRVPGPVGTEEMQAVLTFVGAKFDLMELAD